MLTLVGALIAVALFFDYINGFHDAANSIATVVVIFGGLTGAIIWDLITWYFGLPTSSSHALIGGYAGAAVAKAGFAAIIPGGWIKTLVFIVVAPTVGALVGF